MTTISKDFSDDSDLQNKGETEEIYKNAVKQNGLALEYVRETNLDNYLEICEKATEQNPHAIKY